MSAQAAKVRLWALLQSYRARLVAAVTLCVAPPLLLAIAWLAIMAPDAATARPAAAVGLLLSACGIALASVLVRRLLKPLRQALAALEAYSADGVVPDWASTDLRNDDTGRLLREMQGCLASASAVRQRLERHALEDPLTHAMNRRAAMESLRDSVARAHAEDSPFVLCVIDLDNLKQINDARGHAAGDHALVQMVVSAQQCCLGPADWIARWGGDEFVLGLHADPQIAIDRLRLWTEVLARPESEEPVLASVGAAILQGGETGAQLHRRADAAMYRAKAAGGSRLLVDLPLQALPGLRA
jgi:diguanylate cyclase (GGDEF)-like protein